MTQHSDPDKVGADLNAQRFQMLEDIARELAGEVIFPTCFDVALRLRKELQAPNLSIAQIARIVSVEPLVAAKLTHLANSAIYAASGKRVNDIPAAIVRLGLNVVRATALSIAMGQILHAKEISGFAGLARNLWTHSVKSAVAARILARTYTRINPEEALLAGLVHDLGAFYMLYRASQYPELRERPDTLTHLIMQWHESIGGSLLETLGLPEEIVEAAIDHDRQRPVPDVPKTLVEIVYLSNVLAGAHFEWLYQELEPEDAMVKQVREKYIGLMPQIEADAHEMQAVLA